MNIIFQCCKRMFWMVLLTGLCFFSLGTYLDPELNRLRYYFSLPDHDYLPEMEKLVEEGKILDAIQMGKTVVELRNMPNEEAVKKRTEEIEKQYGRLSRRLKDVVVGFITGQGDSIESVGARTISDFMFIGDLRDLGIESWNEIRHDDGDKVIMALSVAGLAASAATFIPEPTTTGAGVAAQPTLTVFKFLRRMGAITAKFGDDLLQTMKAVKDTKSFAPAAKVINNMGSLVIKAPPGSLPDLIRTVESSQDLAFVSRKIAENPYTTTLFLRRLGTSGLDLLKVGGNRLDQTVQVILRKGIRTAPKVAVGVRGFKFLYTGKFVDFINFSKWSAMVWLGLAGGGALGSGYQGVQLRRTLRKHKLSKTK